MVWRIAPIVSAVLALSAVVKGNGGGSCSIGGNCQAPSNPIVSEGLEALAKKAAKYGMKYLQSECFDELGIKQNAGALAAYVMETLKCSDIEQLTEKGQKGIGMAIKLYFEGKTKMEIFAALGASFGNFDADKARRYGKIAQGLWGWRYALMAEGVLNVAMGNDNELGDVLEVVAAQMAPNSKAARVSAQMVDVFFTGRVRRFMSRAGTIFTGVGAKQAGQCQEGQCQARRRREVPNTEANRKVLEQTGQFVCRLSRSVSERSQRKKRDLSEKCKESYKNVARYIIGVGNQGQSQAPAVEIPPSPRKQTTTEKKAHRGEHPDMVNPFSNGHPDNVNPFADAQWRKNHGI